MGTFKIFFSDLNPDAQARFLEAQGLKTAAEGNYDMDILPIAEFDFETD